MYDYITTVTDMIRVFTWEENETENKKQRTKGGWESSDDEKQIRKTGCNGWESSDEESDDVLMPLPPRLPPPPPPTFFGIQLPYLSVTPSHKKQYRTPELQASPIELPNVLSPINHTTKLNKPVVNLDAINKFICVVKENGFYDGTGTDYGYGQYVDIQYVDVKHALQ